MYIAWSGVSLSLWHHLAETNLWLYTHNTFALVLGVGIGTTILGVSCAWCMVHGTCYGKRILQIGLILPLAMPAYIIAYTYTGILDVSQTHIFAQLVNRVGDIRSLFGAICMLSLVLFPYVYILAFNAFTQHVNTYCETCESLGASSWQYFTKIALPLSRPAIFAGAALAMMEALADYGTVAYFGVSTLTTGIFRIWFGMGEQAFASQLASLLATLVLLVLVLEQFQRRKLSYYQNTSSQPRKTQQTPMSKRKLIITLYLSCVVGLGFFIPLAQLGWWSIEFLPATDWSEYRETLWQTLSLAGIAATVIVLLAIVFAYSERFHPQSRFRFIAQFISLGYAIPGVVIAVGVMVPFGWLDMQINHMWFSLRGEYLGLIFSGTIFALIFAYSVRFLNIAKQNVGTQMANISPSFDDAVTSLGQSRWKLFYQVHLPMLKPAILSAFVLIFVDVLKELPATLILRPFNFNTFAIKAFEYASDERLAAAALPAISIVIAGIIPIYYVLKNVYPSEKAHVEGK